MKYILIITSLALAMSLSSCSDEPNSTVSLENLSTTDIIGDWQVISYSDSNGNVEPTTSLAFGLYCDAIIFKDDFSFAVYYQNFPNIDPSRTDGTWDLIDTTLYLYYGLELEVGVIDIEESSLTVSYSWLEGIEETIELSRN